MTRSEGFDAQWDCRILSLPAPGKGHDAALISENFAGVADGATPLFGASDEQVYRYSVDCLALLSKYSCMADDASEVARRTVVDLRASHSGRHELSACIAWCRVSVDAVFLAVLGNCVAVTGDRGGGDIAIVEDRRVEKLDGVVTRSYVDMVRSGIPPERAQELIRPLLREHRLRMNQPNEYYLLANDVSAARELRKGRLSVSHSNAVLLMTDGFMRAVDPFGIFLSIPDLFYHCANTPDDLGPIGNSIRDMERRDPQCLDYPRIGIHDDVTALLLSRR